MNYVYVIVESYYSYTERYADKIVYTTLDEEEAKDVLKVLIERKSPDFSYKLSTACIGD